MRRPQKQEYTVIVEGEAEGFCVGSVPELRGCHSQARSLDKLIERIREAIDLCLEAQPAATQRP